ncbi:cation transporter, partial [Streptomyces sp. DJ]
MVSTLTRPDPAGTRGAPAPGRRTRALALPEVRWAAA